MDFVSPVIDIISRVWDCTATRATYLCKLEKNLNSLRTSLDELMNQRNDVKRTVDDAESNPIEPMKRTDVVDGWLKRVEEFQHEVEAMLEEGSQQIKEGSSGQLSGCFCCCRPKNCWTGYKLGKSVVEKLEDVKKLISDGSHFDVIVAKSRPAVLVDEMPTTGQVVGMDSKLDEIWRLLVTEQNQVRILGLYGMGGVGKTTLLTNLNNEFLKRNHNFDVVLWVLVSKDLKNVQNQIGDAVGLKWEREDIDLSRRAKDIFKVLSRKKFVLLLDDIWERVDLQSIGIPPLDTPTSSTHEGITSKVVFTTRSEVVCGQMEVQRKIRVECLDWDKAWSLFRNKVGEEALNCHPKVPKLAEIVAKKCCGLPLALIAIGRTMASKKTPQEWEHAITVLKRSASEFSGMNDEILPILKFSYDNLKSEKIKKCFLYCSLFPEDHSISEEELIDYWISEGFLDRLDDLNEARNEGYDVIGSLLGSCLLEESTTTDHGWRVKAVKMHDVIRDLALWIASDFGRKKGNFLVQVSNMILKLDEWEKAERIYYSIDHDDHIVNGAPNCPNLLTLLLGDSGNRGKGISDEFFLLMPVLRVLNLSNYGNQTLPTSITSLFKLQHLDLSYADLQVVPSEIKNLVTLKYLDLSFTGSLMKIPPGLMACLTKLQYLNLYESKFGDWEVEGSGPSLRELEGLEHLKYLGITINNILALQKLVSSDKLQLCTRELSVRDVIRGSLTSITLSPPAALPSSSSSSSSSSTTLSIANLKCLKYLRFVDCDELEEVIISWAATTSEKGEIVPNLLTTLEKLDFIGVPNLKKIVIWEKEDLLQQSTFCFTNLKYVYINSCHALKDLTWLLYAQGLKGLLVSYSNGIEEIISDDQRSSRLLNNTFSTLEVLYLYDLPNLKSICKYCLAFPSLKSIRVFECPELKKLPLDTNSANNNTLRLIGGERKWWEGLEWEDEAIKSTFDPYFKERMGM